ncbi:MAG TPA: VOC family protein [Thermomicrobiales bacterium]|nr:VOC family protein [Thermomicrobiales bacterium]
MASHPIVHVEIPARDRAAATKFYGDLFGWQTEDHAEMDYSTFAAEGGPGGGFTTSGETGKVLIFVGTDDIDASLAKVESLGGKTVQPKMEIPGVGWFGTFSDPAGNTIALYTERNQ